MKNVKQKLNSEYWKPTSQSQMQIETKIELIMVDLNKHKLNKIDDERNAGKLLTKIWPTTADGKPN